LLLSKLANQYPELGLLLIVDSSGSEDQLSTGDLDGIRSLNPRIRLEYLETNIRSLPAQKSIGVGKLGLIPDLQFVMFLDDDTYLSPDTAQEMQQLLVADRDLVALSGVTGLGQPHMGRIHNKFKRVFLLDSENEGTLLSSGINIPVRTYSNLLVSSGWLIGCSMWKIKDLDPLKFPTTLPGSALYEDVIISQSIRGIGNAAVAPWLKLEHSESPSNRPNSFLHARRNQRNRYELVRLKNAPVRLAPFWWATFGLALEGVSIFTARIIRLRWDKLKDPIFSLSGLIVGSIDVLLSRNPR